MLTYDGYVLILKKNLAVNIIHTIVRCQSSTKLVDGYFCQSYQCSQTFEWLLRMRYSCRWDRAYTLSGLPRPGTALAGRAHMQCRYCMFQADSLLKYI